MNNRFYSQETVYIKISRNGNEKTITLQIKSFFQHLKSITFPSKILWENRPLLTTEVIVQIPKNYKESFFEIAEQKLPNFTIKEVMEKEVNEMNNDVSGNFIPDQHSCERMDDVQNDLPEVMDIEIDYQIDGWQLIIDLFDCGTINLPVNFCPFCGKN